MRTGLSCRAPAELVGESGPSEWGGCAPVGLEAVGESGLMRVACSSRESGPGSRLDGELVGDPCSHRVLLPTLCTTSLDVSAVQLLP